MAWHKCRDVLPEIDKEVKMKNGLGNIRTCKLKVDDDVELYWENQNSGIKKISITKFQQWCTPEEYLHECCETAEANSRIYASSSNDAWVSLANSTIDGREDAVDATREAPVYTDTDLHSFYVDAVRGPATNGYTF